jgi:hypothetical protein
MFFDKWGHASKQLIQNWIMLRVGLTVLTGSFLLAGNIMALDKSHFRSWDFPVFNLLKPSGNYVSSILIVFNAVFCICGFRMVLTVNSDYFLKTSSTR